MYLTCFRYSIRSTTYRALGQGAFGEVYQGYLRHVAGDSVEMPVAVKVLQVLVCRRKRKQNKKRIPNYWQRQLRDLSFYFD